MPSDHFGNQGNDDDDDNNDKYFQSSHSSAPTNKPKKEIPTNETNSNNLVLALVAADPKIVSKGKKKSIKSNMDLSLLNGQNSNDEVQLLLIVFILYFNPSYNVCFIFSGTILRVHFRYCCYNSF